LLTRVKDEYLQRSYVTKTTNHGKGQRILVVFSHGNASDLGDVYFFGERLIMQYDVDFLAYDYTGYGLGKNTFEISEKQIYDDLQNVLSFATVQLHYKLNQIVLWGFSLGSGPTVELASRLSRYQCSHNWYSIGGVVL
jgi:dienelactone hydrolase